MTIIGLRCERGYRTIDECLSCHKRCIIAAPILELKAKSEKGYYAKREREYHVTSLLGCPRKAILGRVCGDFTPPVWLWKMQMGTLGHEMMERYPQGEGVSESTLTYLFNVPIDGKEHGPCEFPKRNSHVQFPQGSLQKRDPLCHDCLVVGRFDWYSIPGKRIHDYKFISTTKYIPDMKHFRQMAVYYIIGTRSGAFSEEDIVGAQIDYINVTTGRHHPHRADGVVFKETIRTMEEYIPKMLRHYIEAETQGVLPKGDPALKECAYCAPEFKVYCEEGGGGKNLAGMDVDQVKAMVDAYRHDNTPSDDEA